MSNSNALGANSRGRNWSEADSLKLVDAYQFVMAHQKDGKKDLKHSLNSL